MPLNDDPRIVAPCCDCLQPVSIEYRNPWFDVVNRGGYFTIEPPQLQVVVLPVVDNRNVVMVRVKRPVIADTPLELPAGAVNDKETLCQAAARELREETGISVFSEERFIQLPPLSVSPNRSPLLTSVFMVCLSGLEYRDRMNHDNEIAEVILLSYEQVKSMIMGGLIYVTVPLAILSRHILGCSSQMNKPSAIPSPLDTAAIEKAG